MMHKVKVDLGGQPRQLLIDFNALCLAEEQTGLNLLGSLESYTSARVLRALVWAALVLEPGEKRPDLETVGGWVQEAGVEAVVNAVLEAWLEAMPEATAGEEGAQGADPFPPS